MKNIVVFSDTHNHPLKPEFWQILDEADYVFFLGDGLQGVSKLFLKDTFFAVRGNCDFAPIEDETIVQVEGVKFLLTHGDRFGVRHDTLNLLLRAKEVGANCSLYGHTHVAEIEIVDNITLLNPGSLCESRIDTPSYAYISVIGSKLLCKIVHTTN